MVNFGEEHSCIVIVNSGLFAVAVAGCLLPVPVCPVK